MRPAVGCIALGLLLVVVAGTFDAEPLYVAGIALGLLGLGTAVWIGTGARGVSLTRRLDATSVSEGEPLPVRVEIRAGRLPLPPGWLHDPLMPDPVRLTAGLRRRRLRLTVSFPRRGRQVLEPSRLVLRDALGLAHRVVESGAQEEVTVLPAIHPVRTRAGGGDAARSLRPRGTPAAAAETEVDGLRPHREGAPASRIHWPAVARGHGLVERRMSSEAQTRPLVVLDPRDPARIEDLDCAVRAAASLALHFARASGCALLLPGERRATMIARDLAAWPAAHVRLALLTEAAPPVLRAAQNARGLLVYVCARLLDRPPRALGRMPGGCLLVVPGPLEGRREVLEVAGCHGYLTQRTGAGAALAAVEGG
jgi:uncharacterized protein (DUF58 family)